MKADKSGGLRGSPCQYLVNTALAPLICLVEYSTYEDAPTLIIVWLGPYATKHSCCRQKGA